MPKIWQEKYVLVLLCIILYSYDPTYWLEAYYELDPLTSPDGELQFLQAAESLFTKGLSWKQADSIHYYDPGDQLLT